MRSAWRPAVFWQPAIAALGLLVSGASYADPVLKVRTGTGTPATVPTGNDYPFLDTHLVLTLDGVLETTGAGRLTFEYLGYEARSSNSFLVGGEQCFRTANSKVGETCSAATTAGSIDFAFRTDRSGRDANLAVWDNRAPPRAVRSFGVGIVEEAPNRFLILWDSGADGDYDDLGVRVVFEPKVVADVDTRGVLLAQRVSR